MWKWASMAPPVRWISAAEPASRPRLAAMPLPGRDRPRNVAARASTGSTQRSAST